MCSWFDGVLRFFCDFSGYFSDFQKFTKHHPSHEHPLNSSEACLKSPDGAVIKFSEKSKVPFFYGRTPTYTLMKLIYCLSLRPSEALVILQGSYFRASVGVKSGRKGKLYRKEWAKTSEHQAVPDSRLCLELCSLRNYANHCRLHRQR